MTNLFDALEVCLQEMEDGAGLESVLARFPEHAGELLPILKTAAKARSMAPADPLPEIVRRSRARVMQRAALMRESKVAPRRRMIPLFQRLAISFALAAVFLLSGNGLLNASASALPGERLYPVKRGWETIRLFLVFDSAARGSLEQEFENERLHEANELLLEGRHEEIQFAGVFMQVNGVFYISGLQVILPAGMNIPANGDAVVVIGRTNAQGFVEVISLNLLPAGSVVPVGNPVEVELESGSDSGNESAPVEETVSGSGTEAFESQPEDTAISGTLQVVSTTNLVVSGMTVYLDNSRIEGQLCVGMLVEVKGYYAEDGRFIVLEAKGEGQCSGGASSGSSSNGGTNSNGSSNSNGSTNSNGSSNSNGGSNSNDDHGGGSNNDSGKDDPDNGDSGGDNSNTDDPHDDNTNTDDHPDDNNNSGGGGSGG